MVTAALKAHYDKTSLLRIGLIKMNIKIVSILVLIFLTYSAYTYLGYHEGLRNSRYFFVIGLSLAIVSNLSWMMGVRILNAPQSIFWLAIGFDIIVTTCSLYVPIVLSKVKFNSFTWLGIGLIVGGLLIIKNLGIRTEV